MTQRYTLRQLAQDDLDEIWRYSLKEWGVEQADRYLRALLARFEWLSLNPLLGKSRDEIKPGYYSFPEGSHVIFYRPNHHGIDVIGILHQRMDVTGYFEKAHNDR